MDCKTCKQTKEPQAFFTENKNCSECRNACSNKRKEKGPSTKKDEKFNLFYEFLKNKYHISEDIDVVKDMVK